MKITNILTYYINVDKLTQKDAIDYLQKLKDDYALSKSELPEGTLVQWLPVEGSPTKFQVDIIRE